MHTLESQFSDRSQSSEKHNFYLLGRVSQRNREPAQRGSDYEQEFQFADSPTKQWFDESRRVRRKRRYVTPCYVVE